MKRLLSSLRTNPFLRWELRQQSKSATINWSFVWLRVIPLSFLTLVAFIPVFYYIDDSRVDWLPWMAIVLLMPRPILAIRSIFMGIHNIRQDTIQGRWELMILTGIPARKIVWHKWLKVVRQTAPDQILFSLPAVGLALGISQFFLATNFTCLQAQPISSLAVPYQTITVLFHPYCYSSAAIYYAGQINPSGTVYVIGTTLLLTMTLFETSLNASIGLLAGFSNFASRGLGIIYGVVIRGSLLGIIFLAIPLMRDYISQSFDCSGAVFIENFTCRTGSYQTLHTINQATDTLEIAIMPLLDQGTLLAANIMRPKDDRLWQIYFRPRNDYRFRYLNNFKYETSHIFTIDGYYDNRPFVLRNLIAALISAFFYWLLIRYFLRRATRFAIVNHGASGYLEL